MARGGKFLAGFLSAGFSQGLEQGGFYNAIGAGVPAAGDFGGYARNAVVSAVVGGSASVLGGGKFKNGAITGAFSRLFNDVVSDNRVYRNGRALSRIYNRIETVEEYGEWNTALALGDILADKMMRSRLRLFGIALDTLDVANTQIRYGTVGQDIVYDLYAHDTLYDATDAPNDPSKWKEDQRFRSDGVYADEVRVKLPRYLSTQTRQCIASNFGCYP